MIKKILLSSKLIKTAVLAASVCFTLYAVSCSKVSKAEAASDMMMTAEAAPMMMKASSFSAGGGEGAVMTRSAAPSVNTARPGAAGAENVQAIDASVQTDRKLIYRGSVTVEVESLAETAAAVELWTKEFGGYISYSQTRPQTLSMTVRVPTVKFDQAMSAAAKGGRILGKSVSTEDVTEQFYDTKIRLETRRILQERLSAYLREAKRMEDLLSIERELNEVLSEIESTEGALRRLTNNIDYATVSIEARLPAAKTESGSVFPDLGEGMQNLIKNIVSFFYKLFFAVIYIAVIGVPIVVCAAFLFWITFGRLGLVKKLFRRLGGRKNTHE